MFPSANQDAVQVKKVETSDEHRRQAPRPQAQGKRPLKLKGRFPCRAEFFRSLCVLPKWFPKIDQARFMDDAVWTFRVFSSPPAGML